MSLDSRFPGPAQTVSLFLTKLTTHCCNLWIQLSMLRIFTIVFEQYPCRRAKDEEVGSSSGATTTTATTTTTTKKSSNHSPS